MIQINDNDIPIVVAERLITGTKGMTLCFDDEVTEISDRIFTTAALNEIALHLLAYTGGVEAAKIGWETVRVK